MRASAQLNPEELRRALDLVAKLKKEDMDRLIKSMLKVQEQGEELQSDPSPEQRHRLDLTAAEYLKALKDSGACEAIEAFRPLVEAWKRQCSMARYRRR
jgi:hypothetical protein